MEPLKFILVPMGSAGDVQPLVWLGRILRARGHKVVVISQKMVAEMPERAGLATVEWGNREEEEQIVRNADLWHPRKAFHLLARHIPKWAAESVDIIRREVRKMENGGGEKGRTVLLAGALAFGARILAEVLPDVPLLTVHLQPAVFMSVDESPVTVARAEWLPRAPRMVRSGFFGMANWMIDRRLAAGLQQARIQAGVMKNGRLRGVMKNYWNSPDGVLCLFPEWFARKAKDWPKQAVLTRFPLYDESAVRPPDAELQAFLREGPRPVVITPGSANAHAGPFFDAAVKACKRANQRALVVTRFPEQFPAELPATMRCFTYVPFSQVFPQATAVVHHGGIGTTAQCLAAGVPQLIMPLAHDQPDNAARVKRLGVGDYLYPREFSVERVAVALQGMIGSGQIKERCEGVKRRVGEQMSEDKMGELIELLSERALRVRQINGEGVESVWR
jgi:UDP:flavonoid glycosyltransferase YjiC (YdhE family)